MARVVWAPKGIVRSSSQQYQCIYSRIAVGKRSSPEVFQTSRERHFKACNLFLGFFVLIKVSSPLKGFNDAIMGDVYSLYTRSQTL